ncbi:MAG: hypothetical protein HXY21_11295 [Parvularculaceae bacterium]|nr:hypothetical protein [Parvularculaceae bacterium]
MRTVIWVFAVLGAIFLLFFVALAGFGLFGAKKGFELAKAAAAYADETIAAYGAAWDESVLTARAAPELLAVFANDPEALDRLSFTMDAQAGAFVAAEPASCANFTYTATSSVGEIFTADCNALGAVARGAAEFKVSVVYRRGEWRLLGFVVNVAAPAPDSATSTLVSFAPAAAPKALHESFRASFGDRTIVFSPAARSVGFELSGPSSYEVGVHAQSTPAPTEESHDN